MVVESLTLVYVLLIFLVGLNSLTLFYVFKWLSSLNGKLIESDSAIATLFQRLNDQIAGILESSQLSEPVNPIQAIFAQIIQESMLKKTTLNNRDQLGQFVGIEQDGKGKEE